MKRLLIIGCGDVALRMLPALAGRRRIYALTHSRERHAMLRGRGVLPIAGDLDRPNSLRLLAGLADEVVHAAPPPGDGLRDTRTANLLAALAKARSLPQHIVYISTSGVYGDCGGEWAAETRPLKPMTERARRRADAERRLREFGRRNGVRVSILRAPGIYAAERLPLSRLEAGLPAPMPDEDPYSNHVHADDLARMVLAALHSGKPCRVYNAADDSALTMGEYFDHVAASFGLPPPPRMPLAEVAARVPAVTLSFMGESRRLSNQRVKRELRVKLRYPTVEDGIAAAVAQRTGANLPRV